MIRLSALLLLLLPWFALSGCADSNPDAPSDRSPHPNAWIATHPASAETNIDDCKSCHGAALDGSGEAVSCYYCHAFNISALDFIYHPDDWDDPYTDHRRDASELGFSVCGHCHGADLHGSPAAPSCFSTSFDGQSCHGAEGPKEIPHTLDGTYTNPANHGPDAKADLTECQACHGEAGGPGDNPRFNVGIDSMGGTGCEACHGVNLAHPANWAGPNNTFHYSAGNIDNACTLCHGAALDGDVGVSCLGCHAETTDFTLNCTFCHGYPPAAGVNHFDVATDPSDHDVCVACHGMKQSDTGGNFDVAANYLLFDKATDTIGDHWDGAIDMNASAGYNENNWGCDLACHANDGAHQLSDSGLTVESKEFGFGEAIPHSVDGTFLDQDNHGPAAKGLSANFPNGLLICQLCHAETGSNPRFNVSFGSLDNGCEFCHNDLTAHPSTGGGDNYPWYDNTYRHGDIDASKFTDMCSLCHGASLDGVGGVGPGCLTCHKISPESNPSGCVSCHNLPPDGQNPPGSGRPNRNGSHSNHDFITSNTATCVYCHDGVGVMTSDHFDTTGPADVVLNPIDGGDDISVTSSTASNTTCTGVCHDPGDPASFYGHGVKNWY